MSSATPYKLTIGGVEFDQPSNDAMETLVFEDHVDMVSMLTVRIGGGETHRAWSFAIGDEVECSMGSGEDTLFSGEVTALEPSYQGDGKSTITVRALDKTHRLGRGRLTRYWEEMTDSDVAAEVGAECELSVDADPTDETMPYILQRNESNITFLKRLAARNNFQLRVEEGNLIFKKASFEGSAQTIEMGENLRSVRFNFNSIDQVQKVVVRGWDITAKEEIVGEATSGDVTAIGGGEIGADVAGAFGESTAYVTDVPVSSQGVATLIAQAEMERMARQFCRGTCNSQGNDKIRAGTMVEFEGISTNFCGSYYVLATRHVIGVKSGYTTEFTFCSNTLGS